MKKYLPVLAISILFLVIVLIFLKIFQLERAIKKQQFQINALYKTVQIAFDTLALSENSK